MTIICSESPCLENRHKERGMLEYESVQLADMVTELKSGGCVDATIVAADVAVISWRRKKWPVTEAEVGEHKDVPLGRIWDQELISTMICFRCGVYTSC